MADTISVDMIVEAITKGFDNVLDQYEDLEQKSKKNEQQNKKTAISFTELNQAVELGGKVIESFKKGYEFAREGAEIQALEGRFSNLSQSIGGTADALLGDLRNATSGMISDAQLMSGASDLIELGLAKTQDETILMSELVGKLGLDLQVLGLTIANESTARLDSLGLSMETVNGKVQEYVNAGYDKHEAFKMSVLDGLQDRLELVGDTADTNVGSFMRFEAATENLGNRLKLLAADALTPAIEAATNLLYISDELNNAVENEGVSAFTAYLVTVSETTDTGKALVGNWAEQRLEAEKAAEATRDFTNDMGYYQEQAAGASYETDLLVGELKELTEITDEERKGMVAAGEAAQDYDIDLGNIVSTTQLYNDVQANLNDILDGSYDKFVILDETMQNLGITVDGNIALAGSYNEKLLLMADDMGTLEDAVNNAFGSMESWEEQLQKTEKATGDAKDRTGEASEALTTIKEKFVESGGGAKEAEQAYMDANAALDVINGKKVTVFFETDYSRWADAPAVGGAPGVGSGIPEFAGSANDTGAFSPGAGGGGVQAAHGADFIVPPGFPNDSFRVNVTSGEKVKVTPANQVNSGRGGGSYTLNVYSNAQTVDVLGEFNALEARAGGV